MALGAGCAEMSPSPSRPGVPAPGHASRPPRSGLGGEVAVPGPLGGSASRSARGDPGAGRAPGTRRRLAGAQGQVQEGGEGSGPGARRQGVAQVAARAESTSYLDFRPGNRVLLRRQVSICALGVGRLGGVALRGARGRAALGTSGLAGAAAAAPVAATVFRRVVQQAAQGHCGTRTGGGEGRRPETHAASGPGARGKHPPPRPGAGHLAKRAAVRGWAREPATAASNQPRVPRSRPQPSPGAHEGPWATRRAGRAHQVPSRRGRRV